MHPKTIIIELNGAKMRIAAPNVEGYNRASELLQRYYENSPSSLIDIPISPEDQADWAYYQALAEQLARGAPDSDVPIGKRVG